MRSFTLSIKGMHCNGCRNHVEQYLKDIDGVENFRVSLEEERAEIAYSENKTAPEKIVDELRDTNFEFEIL